MKIKFKQTVGLTEFLNKLEQILRENKILVLDSPALYSRGNQKEIEVTLKKTEMTFIDKEQDGFDEVSF